MTKSKSTWKIFWDLQCPYSKKNWEQLPSIKERFGADYEFEVFLTSLAFHPQAFPAQCGAALVESKKGRDAKWKYVDACFANQETYMNKALGDAKKSDVSNVFCDLANEAGVLDDNDVTDGFTKEVFLEELDDWVQAVQPAYTEHKIALGYGVYGTPKHVIHEELVPDTESAWGPDEWAEKLKTLQRL